MSDSDEYISDDEHVSDDENESEEIEQDTIESDQFFTPARIMTDTCLHAYAIRRITEAENGTLKWPPLMLKVFRRVNDVYTRKANINERNFAMLELLLNVPIQLQIKHHDGIIRLDEPGVIDYNSKNFIEARHMLDELIHQGVLEWSDIRDGVDRK